jgi:hypothetical protein
MSHARRVAVPLALSLAACVAQAQDQERPWYIGAHLGYTHDSNVFRRDADKISDSFTSAGVVGGLHWRPGRQHLYLDGNAENNRYSKLDQLDNTSHFVVTGLDWQTVEHLSGSFRYVSRKGLSDFSVIGTPEDKNIERGQDGSAVLRYGFVSQFGIEGGVARRKLDYSITTDRNTTSDAAWLGGRYGVGGPLTLGITARSTKGDTPGYKPLLPLELFPPPDVQYGPVEPDKSDRQDIDFTAVWQPSGLSLVTARVSLSREDHTAPSLPDVHGLTGQVTWEYKWTGKTTVRGSLIRDTGNETSFLSLEQIGLKGLSFNNNNINWTLLAAADWQATAKILVTAGLRYVDGKLYTITGQSYDNSTTRFRLAGRYFATRNVTLMCSVLRDTGSASASATVYNCNAEFIVQ